MARRSLEDYIPDRELNTGRLVHIVRQGDNLWNIAKEYGIPLTRLRQLNPQLKGDMIHPEDRLNISPEYREQIVDIREERARENLINIDSFNAIQSAQHDSNYVVVDKKNKRLNIFDKNNNLLYSTTDISTGASGDDYNTITYVDKKGTIRSGAGNNSTPAGISVITGEGTYHGFPSFTRGRIGNDGTVEDIASSMHYGNTEKKNSSNGCVRVKGKTLEDMSKLIGQGTMVYTLPEKGGSRFSLRNGKLNFTADNPYGQTEGAKKYWDDYNIRIDKSYSPLQIYYNGDNMDADYNGNVLNFVNSISSNKQALQKRFNLSSDEYNRLAELAVGIAQQESKYGTSRRYKAKANIPDWIITLAKGGGNPARSRGLTQIKINGDNQEMRNIYAQLGVNDDTIDKPEVSAIATIARLAYMYNSEVKGRNFKGEGNAAINPYDALLYKYMGRNQELKNKTATPDKNNYIRNVKKYSLEFGFLEPRMVEV